MSRHKKLLARFLAKPSDFTYDELKSLLAGFGYRMMRGGKTAGSGVAFIHKNTKHIIRLHRPHPGSILKRYQMADLERELRAKGFIS